MQHARCCNLCIPVRHTCMISAGHNLPRAISYDPWQQRSTTCICACLYVSKYHRAYITLMHYTLCKSCDIRSSWKYFPYTSTLNTWLCDIITRWYSKRRDSTVLYTQEQVCYFTVGDCCRVFLLHFMYECVEMTVIIWCWTSGQMGNA